jgi:beta-carotene 15,15'-dioxygenase
MSISRHSNTALWTAAGLMAGLLWWFDRSTPNAGLFALLLLTLTTGLFHGALDAVILLQQFRPVTRAVMWALVYLVAVLVLGGTFASHAGAALVLLLLLSIWHFGEPFDAGNTDSAIAGALTRTVQGGAPVLIPVLTSARQLETSADGWINLLDQEFWPVWRGLAWAWLALLAIWLLWFARTGRPAARRGLGEIAGIAALNCVLTPLMAFALYFGLYHAPAHIIRVARASGGYRLIRSPATVLTMGLTFALAIILLWRLQTQIGGPWQISRPQALQWLSVGLLALTVPHVVLISCFAGWLSKNKEIQA